MRSSINDWLRAGANLAFAVAQPLISAAIFFRGFRTSPVPLAAALPTPIQPAEYAFSIWGLIYLGCGAYAVHQALPRNWTEPLLRRIGWYTAATMALCCTWLLCARYGPVYLTVPLIIMMLVSLLLAMRMIAAANLGGARYFLIAAPFGLYAGWLSVATFANMQEVLAGYGVGSVVAAPTLWSVLMIAAAACVAAMGTRITGGNIFYTAAVAWALIAISVANAPRATSQAVAIAAIIALALVAALYAYPRFRARKE